MKTFINLIAMCLLILTTGRAMAEPVIIHTESPILTFPGVTLGTGTGDLVDGVLTYELVYLIDMGDLAQAILVTTGTIYDGEPPTNFSSASACTGSALVCDPIELDAFDEITFVSGGPLSTTGVTVLTTPPSASGNSAPTTWTITAGEMAAVPVSVTAYAEYADSVGTAVGNGTGELVNGVLTYEMEYVLDLIIFEPTTMTIHGTLFDGAPPTGITSISACEGSPLVCDDLALDTFRPESFESGGPISEVEVTILYAGPSASGRTPPSTLTITPVDNGNGGNGGNGGGCTIGSSGRFDPALPAILLAGLGLLGWRRHKARR
jgi:hypothetical protein